MKRMRSKVPLRWFLITLTGLGLLTALLRGLVQSYLAEPAAQALWWLRLQYLRIPQDAIWMIFLLAAYLLFFASLRRSSRDQPLQWEESAPPAAQPLQNLTRLIESGSNGYARYRLCQKVSEMALVALAERTGHTVHQLRTAILEQGLDLPEEVASYLREGIRMGEGALADSLGGLTSRSRIDPRLYRTLEFLENEEWMEHINGRE
jgi:hypothetical protein